MLSFFNLAENPFSVSPDPRYFFVSKHYRGIIAKVGYVVEHRQGLTVIYGDVGTGKTSLARVLVDRLSETNHVVFITNPNFKSDMHMVKAICAEFGLPSKRSLFEQMEVLQAHLIRMYGEDRSPVLIVDEAQLLRGQQFEIIRQFSNFETNDTKLLQIILAGQLDLKKKLLAKKALLSRVVIQSTLQTLPAEEMADMLQFRITAAGGNGNLLARDSIHRVCEVSKGVPREAVKVCGLAMKLAHMNREKIISPNAIDLAHKEMAS